MDPIKEASSPSKGGGGGGEDDWLTIPQKKDKKKKKKQRPVPLQEFFSADSCNHEDADYRCDIQLECYLFSPDQL